MSTLNMNWDDGLHIAAGVPLGTSWGSVDITQAVNALNFSVTLDQSILPTFFYNAASFGFNLDIGGASISNVNFGAGTSFQVFNGGVISDAGSFNYSMACTNCNIFGNLVGAPQSSHLSFIVSAPNITIADLHNNGNGWAVSSGVWQLVVDGVCAVADQGEIASNAPVAAVPEPATWMLLLAGFAVMATLHRYRRCLHA